MSKNPDLRITPQTAEAAMKEKKRRDAQLLLDQLTQFADTIATDASGDGEFDVEFSKCIQQSRACLLRWIAINSPGLRVPVSAGAETAPNLQ